MQSIDKHEEFVREFSKQFISRLKTNGFSSVEKFCSYLSANGHTISESSLDKYRAGNPATPNIYFAALISKALNFSLDELRDKYIVFKSITDNKTALDQTTDNKIENIELTVSDKLMEYREKYITTSTAFPSLADLTLYKAKDIPNAPCLFEFLVTVRNFTDMVSIKIIADSFNERYFMRNDCIVEKASFIADCKKRYKNSMLTFLHNHDGDFDKSEAQEDDAVSEFESTFNAMLKEYGDDLNLLYDKVCEYEKGIDKLEDDGR